MCMYVLDSSFPPPPPPPPNFKEIDPTKINITKKSTNSLNEINQKNSKGIYNFYVY